MKRFALLAAAILCLSAQTGWTSTPSQITAQGKLTNAAGSPLPAGVKTFVFRIFNAQNGGAELWPGGLGETQFVTTDAAGLWKANVGSQIALTEAAFDGASTWLEITVNDGVTVTTLPRTQLVTVPYTQRVATVDGATGGQVSGKITTTGVGDGVEIQGPGIGNANEAYIRFGDQNGTQFGYVGDANPANPDMYVVAHTGGIHLYSAGGDALTVDADANVGIGTTDPGYRFQVGEIGALALTVGSTGNVGVGIQPFGGSKATIFTNAPGDLQALHVHSNSANRTAMLCQQTNGGDAAEFRGDVDIQGTLTKDAGSFKIDHPLDPANKYLSHSFVESPDMKNIYDGVAVLDSHGEAAVVLPDWFGALNKDFRYQLTAIGAPGPTLYIAKEISNNQFQIAGGEAGMKVSWQVTGIRQDPYANAHRIPVEEEKLTVERGYYRHPQLHGQPEEKQIEWARQPELMKQMKEKREATELK